MVSCTIVCSCISTVNVTIVTIVDVNRRLEVIVIVCIVDINMLALHDLLVYNKPLLLLLLLSFHSSIISISALFFLIISMLWVVILIILHLILLVLLIDLVSSWRFITLLVIQLLSQLFLLLSSIVISTVTISVMALFLVVLSWWHHLIHVLIDWNILWMSHSTKGKRIWLSVWKLILCPVVANLRCLWILGCIELCLIVSVLFCMMKIIIVNRRSGMTFMLLM